MANANFESNGHLLLSLQTDGQSLSFGLFDQELNAAGRGQLAPIGAKRAQLRWQQGRRSAELVNFTAGVRDVRQGLRQTLAALPKELLARVNAVVYRIPFGGEQFTELTKLDGSNVRLLGDLTAPPECQQAEALRLVEAGRQFFNEQRHYGAFDTQWGSDLPASAYLYALPPRWYRTQRLRRYLWNGLAHQELAEQAAAALGKPLERLNLITAWCDRRTSLAAVRRGQVIDSSDGYSPLGGLPGWLASGDLDPTVTLALLQQPGQSVATLRQLLLERSGLSSAGGAADLGTLFARAGLPLRTDTRVKASREQRRQASAAVDLQLRATRRSLAGLTAALGQVDAVAFGGQVGQGSSAFRQAVVRGQVALAEIKCLNFTVDSLRFMAGLVHRN